MNVKALIASLESAPIGDGDLLGEPFRCLRYQRKFLRGAFAPGVMRAGLSLARGGGKTGLASALALDSIRPDGALHRDGGETIVVASAFGQARLTFEAVRTSLELMGEAEDYRIRDQQNLADIQHRKTKARLRVAGADNRRAHGWRVNLVIGDEPSQWGPRGELLAAAIRTALGKRKGARAIFIGTRPASDSHFFARLLEESDPSVYAQTHAAGPDDPPFAVKTWRAANPALTYGLPDIETLRAEARLAKRDPAELATIGDSTLAYRIDFRRKLSIQNFGDEGFVLLSGAGGKHICAACLPINEAVDLVIDQTLYWQVVAGEEDAWFRTGILNSAALTEAILPFNPEGDFGPRHIHTLPYRLMPPYDPANGDHRAVAVAARSVAAEAAVIVAADIYINDPNRSLSVRRRKLREHLAENENFQELDRLCGTILGVNAGTGE